jgi:hypothetical protein
MKDLFLGHDVDFWLELKKRADQLKATELLQEIVLLQAKVGYYERKLDEIDAFRNAACEDGRIYNIQRSPEP